MKSKWFPIYVAIYIVLFVFLWSDLLPRWGAFYSSNVTLRLQTDRMLSGHLSMAETPSGIYWDSAWGNGGVQQIWGLGTPLWRLLFEACGRVLGIEGFPDRVAFGCALLCLAILVCSFHSHCGQKLVDGLDSQFGMVGVLLLVTFPPFLNLCGSRLWPYEEVEAYGYLYSVMLMILTARMWYHPSRSGYLWLALLAGFLPLIRPTLGVYGMASMLIAGIALRQKGHGVRLYMAAACVYPIGILVLLWSNWFRFGSMLEFGHSLALNTASAMQFATRFGDPFHSENILSASKELFSLLFLTPPLGKDTYGSNLFFWQSPIFRWRELYITTYDISVLAIMAIGWVWLGRRMILRITNRNFIGQLNVLEGILAWSILSSIPLLAFYLRFPFISSRYLLDFGPAFAAACWASFWLISRALVQRFGNSVKIAVGIGVLGWILVESGTAPSAFKPGDPTSNWSEVAGQIAQANKVANYTIPCGYTNGTTVEGYGIRFNGLGWEPDTAATKACVVLFVENPECLVLELAAPVGEKHLQAEDCTCIQARIGLEDLARKEAFSTPEGVRLAFQGPKKERYRKGVQMVSLAMMNPQELSLGHSKFRLLKVSWREEAGNVK